MKDIKVKETDIFVSWNEAEELLTSLNNLSDDELINCRQALKEHTYKIVNSLHDYLTEDNINEYCT